MWYQVSFPNKAQWCSRVGTRGNGVPTPFILWERVPTPFCTSNITCRCRIQTIILKHGCVLTNVLATRRFSLLDKSQQLVKSLQTGRSNVEIRVGEWPLYSNYLVSSSITFGVGTPRRVARNFDMGGKQQPSLSIEMFNAPYFQSIIHETCICLAFFSWTIVFRFERENKTTIFIELASLKSLYLVKFQVSTLDKSHHLLVKLSLQKRLWQSRCYKRMVCSVLFAANIALDQEVIVADIVLALKGVRKGGEGLGWKKTLELDILQKLYYLRKEINCFRILFDC